MLLLFSSNFFFFLGIRKYLMTNEDSGIHFYCCTSIFFLIKSPSFNYQQIIFYFIHLYSIRKTISKMNQSYILLLFFIYTLITEPVLSIKSIFFALFYNMLIHKHTPTYPYMHSYTFL